MKQVQIINKDVNVRVENAINNAMTLYANKLSSGYLPIGLENAFQMYLADLIKQELILNSFDSTEIFQVHFEKNIPINDNKDYIDIAIEYRKGETIKNYLVELKFKKISDSAPDWGQIESYKDIFNLDSHKSCNANVEDCYFIFLTNYETYIKSSSTKGTMVELPMYDNYEIESNKNYVVSGDAAKNATKKYPNGFTFHNNYKIEYQQFDVNNQPYWYFILKI